MLRTTTCHGNVLSAAVAFPVTLDSLGHAGPCMHTVHMCARALTSKRSSTQSVMPLYMTYARTTLAFASTGCMEGRSALYGYRSEPRACCRASRYISQSVCPSRTQPPRHASASLTRITPRNCESAPWPLSLLTASLMGNTWRRRCRATTSRTVSTTFDWPMGTMEGECLDAHEQKRAATCTSMHRQGWKDPMSTKAAVPWPSHLWRRMMRGNHCGGCSKVRA